MDLKFELESAPTMPGDTFKVVGSADSLGSWDTSKGHALKLEEDGVWRSERPAHLKDMNEARMLEFKFVRETGLGEVVWECESETNRHTDLSCFVNPSRLSVAVLRSQSFGVL